MWRCAYKNHALSIDRLDRVDLSNRDVDWIGPDPDYNGFLGISIGFGL